MAYIAEDDIQDKFLYPISNAKHPLMTAEDDIPEEFLCPITNEIMKHPLMTIHGHTFERDAIFEWLQDHSTCPLSRRELSASKLVTNYALKEKILAWCEVNDLEHLLVAGQDDDHQDVHRRIMMGFVITEKLRREIKSRNRASTRRHRVLRALDRLVRHGFTEFRVQVNDEVA